MCRYIYFFDQELRLFPIILALAYFVCVIFLCLIREKCSCKIYDFKGVILFIFVGVILGGKTLFVLTQVPTYIKKNANIISELPNTGFVFYGGMLGGLVALLFYSKLRGKDFFYYSDTLLWVLPLGQAIGRWGCFFDGCCYGKETDSIVSILYPIDGVYKSVYPVQIFESIGCLVIFIFLTVCVDNKRGKKTSMYLLLYSVMRFILEFFRGDLIRGGIGILSTSQLISVIVFLGSMVFINKYKLEESNNVL